MALLLPGMVTAYGIFLFRQAILAVPNEMLDAGRIDGCSEFSIYLRAGDAARASDVRRVLSGHVPRAAGTRSSVPACSCSRRTNLTLPVVLNLYVGLYANEYGVFLAGTLLAIMPPALLFLALEKEFVSGLTERRGQGLKA